MKFLLGIFLLFFIIVVILGSFFGKIIRFMGGGMNNASNRSQSGHSQSDAPATRKEFSKDEGEYVHYEEIKDEN